MAARSWATPGDVPTPEEISYNVTTNKEADENDATKQKARSQVSASWRWGGVDAATKRWHANYYRGNEIAQATAANSGIHLTSNGAPVAGSSSLRVDNFAAAGSTILHGLRFMIWPDSTIYTTAAAATVGEASGTQIVSDTNQYALGVAVDETNGHIYWSSYTTPRIFRVDLDGSNKTTIYTGGKSPLGLCLDVANEHIYFCRRTDSTTGGEIARIDFDGTGETTLVTTATGSFPNLTPYDICKDSTTIYYTSNAGEISSFAISDPSGTKAVIKSGLDDLAGIDIDAGNSKLYFTEGNDATSGGWISSMDTDGTDHATLATVAEDHPMAIAVDATAGYVYTASYDNPTNIRRFDLSGNGCVLWASIGAQVRALALASTAGYLYANLAGVDDIYRYDVAGQRATDLSVTPVITAAAAAIGDNAPIYFFVPQNINTSKVSGDGELNAIELDEEFVTVWQEVDQPEDADE